MKSGLMEKFRHLILKMHSQSFPRQDVQNRCRGRCSWTFLFHFCGRMSRIVSLLWCFWTFLRHFRGVMSRIVTCGRVFGHFPVTSVSGGPDQAPCGCAFGHFPDTSAARGPLWLRAPSENYLVISNRKPGTKMHTKTHTKTPRRT